MTDWAPVAQTLGAAGIAATSAGAGAFLTYKAAQNRLREERAKAEGEFWRTAYTGLITTARRFDPRGIDQGEDFRQWEAAFYQQLDGVMFAPAYVRAAAKQLRASYQEMTDRLADARAKGKDQFSVVAIDVFKDWDRIVDAFEDAAALDLNRGG